MIPNPPGASQSDTYLLQQISSASPEQLCVMLLEGAERFLLQAISATKAGNIEEKTRHVNRVSAIIEELMIQVDDSGENELAINLSRIYEWWMNQLFEGSRSNNFQKFEMIFSQVDDMKNTWMQVVHKAQQAPPPMGGLGAELMG
ncbi:MAG: flagellar export chaperone FliS [Holophagaceae bacterium]|nr:flagellar export chaperone FliS [Holophagaceae bacterium]